MARVFRVQSRIFLCFLVHLFAVKAFSVENFHLIVSAGALTARDPYASFYQSRIFVGETNAPMVINNADVNVYENESTVFYSEDLLGPADILRGEKKLDLATKHNGFVSYSFRGFLLEGKASEKIKRYVGADSNSSSLEKRVFESKTIWAFSRDEKAKNIAWPKTAAELKRVPAVVISGDGAKYLVVGRSVGGLSARLSLIDRLLKKNENAAFIDLGTDRNEFSPLPQEAALAVLKRQPLAVFLGTVEMAQLLADRDGLKNLETIYPFADNFRNVVAPNKKLAGKNINFWSVTSGEPIWPLYGQLGKNVSLENAVTIMKEESPDPDYALNVVRVFSEQAALEASKSVYVDLVVLVDPASQLPSKEVINLKDASSDLSKHAPIIRVSLFDISEVSMSGNTLGRLEQVIVTRHFIDDREKGVTDVFSSSTTMDAKGSLPDIATLPNELARPWKKADLQMVLGKVAARQSDANIALLEEMSEITPIYGRIPRSLAENLLAKPSNLITITISGKQIKEINRYMNSGALSKKLFFYGLDTKKSSIGKRVINDNERFEVALNESAFLAVFGLSRLGGLGDAYAVRAPFIEAIYVQGDLTGLVYAAPPKILKAADATQEIEQTLKKVHTGRSFHDLIVEFLSENTTEGSQDAFLFAKGRPHHVVTFDISYLDVGASKNFVNSHYEEYQNNKSLPMGRAKADPFLHLFLFAKLALEYDAPSLVTTLGADMKYMHTNLDKKPEKDKTKISLKFRLPWERTLMYESPVVVSPILKSIYETKLVPHFWSHPPDMGPRTQRIDTLLGFNFNFLQLGFNLDIGPVMAMDFNRVDVNDALDFGPGLNFFSKWTLFGPVELSSDITSYYLFPLPSNKAKNKLALGIEGTVWLRLARFYDFSVSAVNDVLIATLQEKRENFAVSSIFGLTISYGGRVFRLFG